MKKTIRKYKNIGYAAAIFFYIDMAVVCGAFCFSSVLERHQIKEDAASILETPDLTGIEPLELAVQQDLQELERHYKNS